MHREIQLTADGSHTISIPEIDVTYHSKHGALQESIHVFITPGLESLLVTKKHSPVKILEIGFGTGLNALLSWQAAEKHAFPVYYTAVELYPLTPNEAGALNYGTLLSMQDAFYKIHDCQWEQDNKLSAFFTLHKKKISLPDLTSGELFDCIYFDAFSPTIQPELWTQEIFTKLFSSLQPGGILLTYCSKSVVRHAMRAAGFTVEKIPGPRGKREMVRAIKH